MQLALHSGIGFAVTREVTGYAAADTIVPHIIGDKRGLVSHHTSLPMVAAHSKLVVMFGGLPHKNAQVSSGGISQHILAESLAAAQAGGAELVSISPIRDDTVGDPPPDWMALRPNTDVALMLGMAHTLVAEGLVDRGFLDRHTIGYDRFEAYLTGKVDGVAKDPAWAAVIVGVEAERIAGLARRMASKRTMIMMSWSLQRAEHGEQPYWMAITLAAMLGQIGLPGGGFGFGYGSVNGIGFPVSKMSWPSLPQGENPIDDFIPVARIADMLLDPGGPYDFNGSKRVYPDIKLVYWAGGNPFHHHQDLNRLRRAWRRPETVIVHESWWNPLARHADIIFPITTVLERDDIAASSRDRFIAASHRVAEPTGEARDDFTVFAALADRMGARDDFTGGLDEEGWLRQLYAVARQRAAELSHDLPDFETFWRDGFVMVPKPDDQVPLLAELSGAGARLKTPSGKIEIFSETIAAFGYADCPGHASWLEPDEWLGAERAGQFPLHLISNQPRTRLHSQYDSVGQSRASKVQGREPMRINPADAADRGIADGDIVRLFNDRGSCLAGAVLSDAVIPGVVQLSTGAWYDPEDPAAEAPLDKHGNPNVLTRDRGTSRLAQGPSAQSCLVEIERYAGDLLPITAFDPPAFAPHPAASEPSAGSVS